MFQPTPRLCARLRLTTKQVNGGYYKGNRTGSMGAHTRWGGYLIDWRKVRHYNVPNLSEFKLLPFVAREMEPTERLIMKPDGTTYTPKDFDGVEYLKRWKRDNDREYVHLLNFYQSRDPHLVPEIAPEYQDERQPEGQLNRQRKTEAEQAA